jgi:hypothetical protein
MLFVSAEYNKQSSQELEKWAALCRLCGSYSSVNKLNTRYTPNKHHPDNLHIELINLQCDSVLNRKFLKQIWKNFTSTGRKKSFLCSDPLG